MNLDKIVEFYADFYVRFNIKYENEEPVFSILTESSWKDFTTHPNKFGNLLEHQIRDLNGQSFHIYVATGTFRKGSIKLENGKIVGRNAENLERILEIPLDVDAIKFHLSKKGIDLRNPNNKHKVEEYESRLHNLPDSKLNTFLNAHAIFIKIMLSKAQIPYSEIVRSGYGHYVKIYISPEDQTRIEEIREFHKQLVSHLNKLAGFELFDRQCVDAGTRVIRIEGSCNLKNPQIPRRVYSLECNKRSYGLDNLIKLIPEQKEPSYKEKYDKKYEGNFPCNELVEIINPYYIKGNRQELILSATGFVAKQGGTFEDAKHIVEALAQKNNDDEINQRIAALQSTFKKFKEGQSIKGYKGLEYILSPDDLEKLTQLVDTKSVEVKEFEEGITPQPVAESQFPIEAFYGFFERYRSLMEPTTEAPPSFHFGAMMTILGTMLNRSVYISYGNNIYLNFFTTLIGRTGTEKKDTSINRAKILFQPNELIHEIIGTGSAEGLLQGYMDEETEIEGKRAKTILKPVEGRIILFTEYEFARFLSKSLQKGSNLLTTYTQLYDCPDEYSPPTRSNSIRTIKPALSFLTGSTLASCEKYLTDEHVQSGFLNRFIFFIDETDKTIPIPPKPEPKLLEDFKTQFEEITTWAYSLKDKEIKMSIEARELWDEFYREWQKKRRLSNPLLADMSSRIPNHIWKIAMLYAVTEQRQVVSFNDLELAILVGDYLEKTSAYLVRHLAKSKTTKIEEYILNKLRSIFPLGMTRTQIHRHVGGKINAIALGKTLEGMCRLNLIAETNIKGRDGKLRPGYVAIV